jgi:hypothetical protein
MNSKANKIFQREFTQKRKVRKVIKHPFNQLQLRFKFAGLVMKGCSPLSRKTVYRPVAPLSEVNAPYSLFTSGGFTLQMDLISGKRPTCMHDIKHFMRAGSVLVVALTILGEAARA